ncbi:hypothetical protein HZS_4250, partial [Henneguya salminicola]
MDPPYYITPESILGNNALYQLYQLGEYVDMSLCPFVNTYLVPVELVPEMNGVTLIDTYSPYCDPSLNGAYSNPGEVFCDPQSNNCMVSEKENLITELPKNSKTNFPEPRVVGSKVRKPKVSKSVLKEHGTSKSVHYEHGVSKSVLFKPKVYRGNVAKPKVVEPEDTDVELVESEDSDWESSESEFLNVSKSSLTCQRRKKGAKGYRPFICEYPGCGKSYTKNNHLQIHYRTHTGEKPFKCDWKNCGRSFMRIDELSRHLRGHVNCKPYVCRICGQRFMRMDYK